MCKADDSWTTARRFRAAAGNGCLFFNSTDHPYNPTDEALGYLRKARPCLADMLQLLDRIAPDGQ
jgi:hypothetical protein